MITLHFGKSIRDSSHNIFYIFLQLKASLSYSFEVISCAKQHYCVYSDLEDSRDGCRVPFSEPLTPLHGYLDKLFLMCSLSLEWHTQSSISGEDLGHEPLLLDGFQANPGLSSPAILQSLWLCLMISECLQNQLFDQLDPKRALDNNTAFQKKCWAWGLTQLCERCRQRNQECLVCSPPMWGLEPWRVCLRDQLS